MATQIRKVIAISVALAILVFASIATAYPAAGFGGQDLGSNDWREPQAVVYQATRGGG